MKLVLDTNVVVAGMRSRTGASAEILRAARAGKVVLLANVALAVEYEEKCVTAEHRLAAGFSLEDAQVFLDALIAMAEPVPTRFLWRPRLRDASDEMVLEAAVNGGADAIVTFNAGDFVGVPEDFGIDILRPAETLRRIKARDERR